MKQATERSQTAYNEERMRDMDDMENIPDPGILVV